MRLTILGGGGFRVPLIYRALLAGGPITAVTLYDADPGRLAAIARVVAALARGAAGPPAVTVTTDLRDAVSGADFVFSAIRVGGLAGRVADEAVAHAEGVLGQETVGAGGIAYGLRTVPVAVGLARRIRAVAPDAWVVNFTNPAGLVTEAMAGELGDRVIGICDSPAGLGRRVLGALGADPARARLRYAGLNHLGWLVGVDVDGQDVLPHLLADTGALEGIEEGRLFGADWIRTVGAVPNEYLHYYYSNRETIAKPPGRGAFLRDQQEDVYRRLSTVDDPLDAWTAALHEREATYMAEYRGGSGVSGGYEEIALAVMRAIAGDDPTTLILNVRNRGTLPYLDDGAVVEVPCVVDAAGARPVDQVAALPAHAAALVAAVKASERDVLHAAATGARTSAVRALATHPLVDSVAVARRLLDGYRAHFPELGYLT